MQSVRPTFLTVLCILTFIGSAYSIFKAFSNYTSAAVVAETVPTVIDEMKDQIDAQAKTEKESEMIDKILSGVEVNFTEEKVKNIGMVSGISSILTLVGAILMWGLQKKGYWIYLIGLGADVIGGAMVFVGIWSGIYVTGSAIIAAIFGVLYGLNLKHLH
ncbi:MAG: hypothetical protein IPH28_24025 [Cytophagaceae bacterium]|nr:hypothetical protein [Cytophagaceae bacterium]